MPKQKSNVPTPPIYGGVDAGGTKFLCAIGRTPTQIERTQSIETTSESRTLGEVAKFFNDWLAEGNELASIGVASFGPLERDPQAPKYGKLCNSPKRGWEHADIGGFISRNVPVPLKIDTDVNGAALAEGRWGAGRGKNHFSYVTVGTGIGVGIVSEGRLVNGLMHPELGHYRPPRHKDDAFEGLCPFHRDCLEGLASGPALLARVRNHRLEDHSLRDDSLGNLADDDAVWYFAAHYLAHLCTLLLLTSAPERIILGGGVMRRDTLLGKIQQATREMLGGYLNHPLYAASLNDVIVPSGLAGMQAGKMAINAGVLGGFILAEEAALLSQNETFRPLQQ